MEKRPREHDRRACWGLEAPWTVFRETYTTALEIIIEIDRHRKLAMHGRFYDIVAMRPKMPFAFRIVTRQKFPFDTRRLEMIRFLYLVHDAPSDPRTNGANEVWVSNEQISPVFPRVIESFDGLAVDFLHEPALPAPGSIEPRDEMATEIGFEDIWKH